MRLIGKENFGEKECLELEGNLVQLVHSFINSTNVYCVLTVTGHKLSTVDMKDITICSLDRDIQIVINRGEV